MRPGRIRLMSPPGHPPSDPLAPIPCLRFDANRFAAPHRHHLLLLLTPSFSIGGGKNSSHPASLKGQGNLVWEEAPLATWRIASHDLTEGS
jgi:hypothetical protein